MVMRWMLGERTAPTEEDGCQVQWLWKIWAAETLKVLRALSRNANSPADFLQ